MSPIEDPKPRRRSAHRRTAMALAATATLAFAACSGDDDTAEGSLAADPAADTVAPDAQGDPQPDASDAGSDPAVDAGAFGPDWLPVWLFLPPDLQITMEPHGPSVGESFVTGFVAGGDAQQLHDDALFMVQSGGDILADEYEARGRGIGLTGEVPGLGFTADHT